MKMNALSDLMVSRLTFPLTNYLMNRRGIMGNYSELLRTERADPEALAQLQLRRLRQVLEHAGRWVPWYQRRFREIGLDPRDIKRLEDLRQIPRLTRQEVIDHHREMVDLRYQDSIDLADQRRRDAAQPIPFARFRRHRLVRNNSSGSTGAPTVFYEDGAVTALNWALEMRLKHWYGIDPGAREARMVRLSTVYVANSASNRWRRMLWHQLILPGINLRASDYEACIRQLEDFQPRVLWGFTGALTGLADYLRRTNQKLSFRPELAIGWAGPVYDHERALLEEVLACQVSNIYGSREVGHVALRCPHGAFHINQEWMLAETEPIEGAAGESGAGELLVTGLVPTPMPFIRYGMGDIARVAPSHCACGRTLAVMEEFVGRTGEIFTTRDGRMIPPNFWCRLFMGREIPGAVQRFQVMYTREKAIVVRIARGPLFNETTEAYLQRIMQDNFAPATPFRIEYVDEIKPMISGKYQMVYQEN